MAENRREAANLVRAFGKMSPAALLPTHAYQYLQLCETSHRGPKGNKEIALAQVILEYGVRTGILATNPFTGVKKLKTAPNSRLVTTEEMALARRVGTTAGGVRQLAALALYTGYLCVRRSTEVLSLRWSQVVEEGILWTASKQRSGAVGRQALIAWSDELRATIDAARVIKRDKACNSEYVFGNLHGERYTKGGWKKTLSNLMAACVDAAKAEGLPFQPFSLQDCRPMGVTERKSLGDQDVMDATLHTSERMINKHYDRRKIRHANANE